MLLIIGLVLLTVPYFTSQYQFYVVERGVQNAVLVLGLVILIGFSGMMTLGCAGLLAVGAYSYAILLVKLGLSPFPGVIIAVVFTTLLGTLLAFPAFRLSGPFLVVVTIGFGEIIRILLLNLESVSGGAYGISGYSKLVSDSRLFYFLMVASLVLLAFGINRIDKSIIGLALKSIRQDEIAAEVMGVDVRRAKVLAYSLSSMLAGLSGVFLANLTGYISPDSFTSAESATYLLMVVMGGMSHPLGAVISSIALTWLPEVLRFLSSSRLLVYSFVLLVYIRMRWTKSDQSFTAAGIAGKVKTLIKASKK